MGGSLLIVICKPLVNFCSLTHSIIVGYPRVIAFYLSLHELFSDLKGSMGQSVSEYVEEVRDVITVAVRNEVFRHVPVCAFIFCLILGISK